MIPNSGVPAGPKHSIRPSDPAQRVDGRFRVESALGQGGMGTVLAVRDASSGERLALKRLSREAGAKYVALFEREYHTLAGLKHPNIVEVFDYGRDGEGPYYTMELLEGGDLRDAAPLPWPDAIAILREIASALLLLHARRLVHRDVSPRNVWRTPDGTIKLIDFGALSAFGRAKELIGTPPFVAPEALHGPALDQRTDLYALGALGYWLLTGLHAFPARDLADLEQRWRVPPKPASRRIRELAREDLPELPAELDALLDALLSQDPAARPSSAAEVIDRLAAFAPSTGEATPVIEGHLNSGAFIGREGPLRGFDAALTDALSGRGSALVVAGAPGLGRTRLLSELALRARMCGALTLQVDSSLHQGEQHGIAQALAFKLLDARPREARALAQPHEAVLGHLSSALRVRLGLGENALAELPDAPGEGRMRVQAALCQWFLDVSRARPLVLFADDVDAFDEASAAFLAALAHQASESKLLLVASLRAEPSEQRATEAFKRAGRSLTLTPLSRAEVSSVLGSMFGDVPRLERLTEMLHRASEGNPAHMMELVEHLVRQQVISYSDATWVLPQVLDPDALPKDRSAVLTARLARLPSAVRAFAQTLSLNPRVIPIELCSALSGRPAGETFAALELLVREGVLIGSAEGYAFTHEALRRVLCDELEPGPRRAGHRVLGQSMLAGGELPVADQLQAGVHLMLGGEDARGRALVVPAARDLATSHMEHLAGAVPCLEQALELLRAAQRPEHEQLSLFAALASAGYYVDRKLAERYGQQATELLERVMGLSRARRWRRLLGRKLAILLSLLATGVAFWRRRNTPCALGFNDAMLLLFNTVATLAGTYSVCLDPDGAARTARVIEPLSALGEDHIAGLMYRFCLNAADAVRDRLAVGHRNWAEMATRLSRPDAIPGLPESLRVFYLAGALYGQGILASWRDDPEALACADRLDAFGLKQYEMVADQVRMMYYGNQGDLELLEHYRKRVELHAIQRGTAWQVETWAAAGQIPLAMRLHDGMRMKQCVEQLRRAAREMESLRWYVGASYGAYLVLRGRPGEALRWLEQALPEQPLSVVGWAHTQGMLARAHNMLGDHLRARELCTYLLAQLSDEDLAFPSMNLLPQVELALADAGLGRLTEAEQQLDALLERHRPQGGPLTLAALYEARVQVALIANSEAEFARAIEGLREACRRTNAPTLMERAERLARRRTSSQREGETGGSDAHGRPMLDTVLNMLRHGGTGTVRDRASWALAQLADFTGIDEGHVYLCRAAGVERVASFCRRAHAAHPTDPASTEISQASGGGPSSIGSIRAARSAAATPDPGAADLERLSDAAPPLARAPLSDSDQAQLDAWAGRVLTRPEDETITAELDEAGGPRGDLAREFGMRRYRLILLYNVGRGHRAPLGGLVVPAQRVADLPAELIQTFGRQLFETLTSPSLLSPTGDDAARSSITPISGVPNIDDDLR